MLEGLPSYVRELFALHRRARHSDSCWQCDAQWPCRTISALIDADHDWALWHEKWCAAMDLVGSLGEDLSRAERIIGLQAAALEVWKKAHPTEDGSRLAALAAAQPKEVEK